MQSSTPSRRELIHGLLGAAAAGLAIGAGAKADKPQKVPAPGAVRDEMANEPRLSALARDRGILFGSAFHNARLGLSPGTPPDPRYQVLIAQQCAVIVAEGEFKPVSISPTPNGPYNFAHADALVDFARRSGLKMRGHTLLWSHPRHLPAWQLTHDFGSRADTERSLMEYVGRICDHFGDFIYSWDVVNEAIDPATGASRPTPFNRILGDDNLDICFHTARAHAPRAQLVYNDYMSWGPDNRIHRIGVLRLLEGFRRRNVPVDALGIQSHISASLLSVTERREWVSFLNDVTAMGYRLLITELDVRDTDLPPDVTSRDAWVAAATKGYLDLMLSYRQLDQLLCWGLADKYSWLQTVDAGKRRDGLPVRPTPYDDDLRPKPMRAAIAEALRAAPRRGSPFL